MMGCNDVANLRKHERHQTAQSIIVQDRMSGQQLGVLVNISLDGLMIAGASALETETIYQLRLLIPDNVAGGQAIDIGVDCLWTSGNEKNANLFWSGCHIIDYADAAVVSLNSLIAHLEIQPC